jgi:hypothetical protein
VDAQATSTSTLSQLLYTALTSASILAQPPRMWDRTLLLHSNVSGATSLLLGTPPYQLLLPAVITRTGQVGRISKTGLYSLCGTREWQI